MANSPFLTTFARHRDPKLLWPLAAVVSVLAHGVALGLVRTLALQTPALPQGEMAPLPIQLVALPLDQPAIGLATDSTGAPSPAKPAPAESAPADPAPASDAPVPMAAQSVPAAVPTVEAPPSLPPQPPVPPVTSPPVMSAPGPESAQVSPVPPTVAPAPPRPAPPVTPAPVVERPPGVESPPLVESPPVNSSGGGAPTPGGAAGQGGQVVPVGIRLNPSGRDIPENGPQLLSMTAIEVRPLVSGCGFANLDALLAGITSASVQMQIRVEANGDISDVRLLQSTGSGAVDDLVGCVVKQRLKLQPASSAGVPQLTDAYILDAQIQF